MMAALLSREAIALLERLPSSFTATDQLGLEPGDRALYELKRARLAETQVWPPVVGRRVSWRSSSATEQRLEVRRTDAGALRIQRLREGRRR